MDTVHNIAFMFSIYTVVEAEGKQLVEQKIPIMLLMLMLSCPFIINLMQLLLKYTSIQQ